jgi:hypothetical protein
LQIESLHSKTVRIMKTGPTILAMALAFGTAGWLPAQNYAITWSGIAGGGAASTNGQYALSGTLGQPNAGGPMTNGAFSVTGGFWVLPIAVPMPGAPALRVVPAGPGQATLSWSPATPGFVLQSSPTLVPTNWTNAPSGTNNPITLPATPPARFYRLLKP